MEELWEEPGMLVRKEGLAFILVPQVLLLSSSSCKEQAVSKVPEEAMACSEETAESPARCPAFLSKRKASGIMKAQDWQTPQGYSHSWISSVISMNGIRYREFVFFFFFFWEFVFDGQFTSYLCSSVRKIFLSKSWILPLCSPFYSLLPVLLTGFILNICNSSCFFFSICGSTSDIGTLVCYYTWGFFPHE